jgi:AbrB family transcriptional regulator (stage V sporulation protein T)
MAATGIIRRIDDLGRVVIPKEVRCSMGIKENDPFEVYISAEGGVVFIPYRPDTINDLVALKERVLHESREAHSTEKQAVIKFAFETIEKIMGEES